MKDGPASVPPLHRGASPLPSFSASVGCCFCGGGDGDLRVVLFTFPADLFAEEHTHTHVSSHR